MSDADPHPTDADPRDLPSGEDAPPQPEAAPDHAMLGGMDGRGYGVVESLASLGKGRRLTGLFRTDAAHGARLREASTARKRLLYEGLVHFRHHSVRASLDVEIERVEMEGDGILAEFTAHGVPYGLG